MNKILTIFLLSIFWSQVFVSQCTLDVVSTAMTLPCGGGTVTLTANGTGGTTAVLNEDFNIGNVGPGWAASPAAQFNNPCDPSFDGGTYMWMGNTTAAPRTLTTNTFDVSCGGDVCFYLDFSTQGGGSPCEGPDLANEGVNFEYSIDGGATWNLINYFQPNAGGAAGAITNWAQYCFPIPAAAETTNTLFHWFQNGSSGTCCDHWGIDDVTINAVNCNSFWYDWSHIPGTVGPAGDNPVQTVNVLADTTFTVTYTNGSGVSCTEQITIDVLGVDADFSATSVCEGTVTQFTDLSVGSGDPITSWDWDFTSNGSVDNTTQNPTNGFVAGTYNVTLTATSSGGCASTITKPVVVNSVPVAALNQVDVCEGAAMSFTDASNVSSGAITNWAWDFGDGTGSSTAQNPSYTYPGSGAYNVLLTVTSDAGCIDNQTLAVNVFDSPTAAFDLADVCDGDSYVFTDNSNGNGAIIDIWEWDFTNDGTIDNTSQNTSNLYLTSGNFDVELTVTTQDGCVGSIVQNITVLDLPNVNFTVSQECEGVSTQFTDGSTTTAGTITSWSWDFSNDGIADDVSQNPTNLMGAAGSYTAALTVTTSNGCVNSGTNSVVVDPIPVADFGWADVCDGVAMNFTNQSNISSGTITGFQWDFGDLAGSAMTENATYTYGLSGAYDVTYTVTSDQGCVASETNTVNVFDSPTADFILADVCDGEDYVFTDNSNGNGAIIDTWEWDFTNDGSVDNTMQNTTNLYPSNGSYDVGLTVTTQEGCVGSVVLAITVLELPTAIFTVTQECQGVASVFTDGSTTATGTITGWKWDFTNDGSVDNVTQNPTNVMGVAGSYTTSLVVTTSNGCSNSTTNIVTIDPLPVADYSWTNVCEGLVMNFNDESTVSSGTITNFQWDFGDLTGSATTQDATYTYGAPGAYNAVYTVTTDQGCINSITNTVEMYNDPTAVFNYGDECNGTPVSFSDNSNGNGATITDFEWDFTNDGTTDYNGTVTDFTYGADGTYDVNLTVTTANGCTDNIVQTVTIFPTPTASFTGQNVCEGFDVTFTNNSIVSSGVITDYAWDFGMGATSTLENPTQTFANEGVYNVMLTITSDNSCTNTYTSPVEIYPTPVAQFISNDVCDGSVASFTDYSTVSNSNTNNNISNWEWDFGTVPAATSVGQFANYTYPLEGTYTVTLNVTSNNGCVNSTTNDVTIYPNPVIDFSSPNPDGCTTWCPDFVNNSSITSGIINSYLWNFGDGTASTQETPVHCYTNNTLVDVNYTVSVTMTSDFGCTTSATEYDFITVYPTPVAAFSNDPLEGTVYEPTIDFINESLISDFYSWDFAGLGVSDEVSPSFRFPDQDSGTYNVCLNVETIHGCVHDTCHEVYLQGFANLYIPNSFTPDGDGINDFFMPSLFGYSEEDYSFMVFDRWGLLLFSTDNMNASWNGTYNNSNCQQDGYVWKIQAKDKYTGEQVEKIGHVMLLR